MSPRTDTDDQKDSFPHIPLNCTLALKLFPTVRDVLQWSMLSYNAQAMGLMLSTASLTTKTPPFFSWFTAVQYLENTYNLYSIIHFTYHSLNTLIASHRLQCRGPNRTLRRPWSSYRLSQTSVITHKSKEDRWKSSMWEGEKLTTQQRKPYFIKLENNIGGNVFPKKLGTVKCRWL